MTITYTIINRGVEGNRRTNLGKAVTSSSEGTLIINPALTYVEWFGPVYRSSGDLVITYPTSFPAKMASGYVTITKISASDTTEWKAVGRV